MNDKSLYCHNQEMLSQKLETVYRTMRNDYYHILVVMLKAMTKFSLSCEHTHTTWEDRTDAASSSAYSRVPTIINIPNSMNGQGNVKIDMSSSSGLVEHPPPMEVQIAYLCPRSPDSICPPCNYCAFPRLFVLFRV